MRLHPLVRSQARARAWLLVVIAAVAVLLVAHLLIQSTKRDFIEQGASSQVSGGLDTRPAPALAPSHAR